MALSSCTPIGSIVRDCRDSVGGIIEIKVKVLPNLSTLTSDYTVTSGTVTVASNSRTGWYTYYMEKETAMYTEKGATIVANGGTAYGQELKIIFNKLSAQIRNELQVLHKNSLQIAVRDANDTYFLLGYEFGMELTDSSASTGTAKGDRSGYELTFTGNERVPKVFLSAASYNQFGG